MKSWPLVQQMIEVHEEILGKAVLEIGCGDFPIDKKNILLDIRESELVNINLVQPANDLSNIADESIDRIITKNCLEHISWRLTLETLKEWLRVLKPGGELDVQVPNVEHLRMILEDPWCYGRSGAESDFEFFCRVAFGHQDYSENSHLAYFSPRWLHELLSEAGFETIESFDVTDIHIRFKAFKSAK